jgi:uncharacterized protein (TIGR02996 family)
MSPDNTFLKAVIAQPDDDTVRLAFADWCDENGDEPRSEFVRVQVELARGVEDRHRRRHLEIRQRDLLIAHETEWVEPLAEALDLRPGVWGGWVFRRGFVEYFHVPATVINRHGERLARLTPVRELFLRPCNFEYVILLCKRPWLGCVTHLYLDGMRMPDAAARALVECPHLTGLRVLRYGGNEMSERIQKRFLSRFPFARWGG